MAKNRSQKKLSPFSQAHQDKLIKMFEAPARVGRDNRKSAHSLRVWPPAPTSGVEDVSIAQFGAQIGIPPIALIDQLAKVGIVKESETDAMTEQERSHFREYLRDKHNDTKPLQPMAVYLQHSEHEELRRLIPNINSPPSWMSVARWSDLSAARRAELRTLVSDEFPELVRAYDWLIALGLGRKLNSRESEYLSSPVTRRISSLDTHGNAPGMGKEIPRPEPNYDEELEDDEAPSDTKPIDESVVLAQANPLVPVPDILGNHSPDSRTVEIDQIKRVAAVKAWVLENAKGICESCSRPAPFKSSGGIPFLEVHHMRGLKNGGSDTTQNTVALCPNCHRELHFGEQAGVKLNQIYARVSRLIRE